MTDKEIKLGVPGQEGQVSFVFSRGGSREGAGRKAIGETKKISLTLSREVWNQLEQCCAAGNASRSEVIREMIEQYFARNDDSKQSR